MTVIDTPKRSGVFSGDHGSIRTELYLVLLAVIWGVNFAVVKWALLSFDPLGFNALRFLIASVVVLVVLRVQGRLRLPAREDIPWLLVLGLIGNTAYQLGFILGLDRTRAGNASLLLSLPPAFVAVFSSWSGSERHTALTWGGVIVSVLGVALVSGATLQMEEGATLVGDLILLCAAIVWAAYTVGARHMIERYGSIQVTAWTLWIGTLGLLMAGYPSLRDQQWQEVGPLAWGALFFSACFAIGLAYLIWNRGVERIGPTRTAIFANVTPIIALSLGAVWLGERLTALSLLGAALTIGGVLLVRADRPAVE
ncbi:MAG TPA: DMT family transporter [Longimicrobiaceae bacterium]|nr:DMT family transporter [Longimicrobiaceae bacterium]